MCIVGVDPTDINHIQLRTMTFTLFKKSIDEEPKTNQHQIIDYKNITYDYELAFISKELSHRIISIKEMQKRQSDLAFEGTSRYESHWNLYGYINPQTGMPANLFVDTGGGGDNVYTGDGNDVVYLGDNEPINGSRMSIIHTRGGHDKVYGSGSQEYIALGDGHDKAYAGFGNDIVEGGAGDDVIDGGEGNDELHGDGFIDWWDDDDNYYIEENRRDTGNDRLLGKGGNDFINGMDGDDFLKGGNGYDLVVGGDGSDTFVVDLANAGHDWILDFNDIGDKLVVKNNGRAATEDEWMIRVGTTSLTEEYIGNIAQGSAAAAYGNGELYRIHRGSIASLQIINAETNHIAASISVNALGFELDQRAINVRTTANTLEYTYPTTRDFIIEF